MKIILRQIHAASVFCNERMGMAQLTSRLVELQAGAAGQPNCRDSRVIERSREFIKAGDAFSSLWEQAINGYIENAGRLAQTNLRCRCHGRFSYPACPKLRGRNEGLKRAALTQRSFYRNWIASSARINLEGIKKGGQKFLPASRTPGSVSQGSLVVSCQTLSRRS